jgi:hypothetical protein
MPGHVGRQTLQVSVVRCIARSHVHIPFARISLISASVAGSGESGSHATFANDWFIISSAVGRGVEGGGGSVAGVECPMARPAANVSSWPRFAGRGLGCKELLTGLELQTVSENY